MERGDRALEALRAITFTALPIDEYITAQMLTGAAYVRLGQQERGAAVLLAATEAAAGVHPTVRSELALQLGIARFRLGQYDEAEQLFRDIPVDADIIYANALEYRGWLAHVSGRFEEAAQWFRQALEKLTTCRRRDRYVEGKSLYGLIAACPEILQSQDWAIIERRVRAFDWSLSGLARWGFWISQGASMMCEISGNVDGARRWARGAEFSAEADAYRAIALCRTAAVFRGLRQSESHAEFVERALAIYETLDLSNLNSDVQQLSLSLAEEIAYTEDPRPAESLLTHYREIVLPTVKMSKASIEYFQALHRAIDSMVLDARGETTRAVDGFTSSFRLFAKLGYRRRATGIALRLARITGEEQYVTYAEDALRGASPRFWMRRELDELRGTNGPALTDTESAVLRLLAHGKTYKEVAAVRGISVKTVGNHAQALFRKFNVHSRAELTAEAIRRRIVVLDAGKHSLRSIS